MLTNAREGKRVGSVAEAPFHMPISVGPVWKSPSTIDLPYKVARAMIVPPVSLRLRAKQRMAPVTRPALNRGSVMVLAAVSLLAPSVRPAVS